MGGGPRALAQAGDGTVFSVQLLVCSPHAALPARVHVPSREVRGTREFVDSFKTIT